LCNDAPRILGHTYIKKLFIVYPIHSVFYLHVTWRVMEARVSCSPEGAAIIMIRDAEWATGFERHRYTSSEAIVSKSGTG
jgi:hypothetical protein